MTCLAYASCQHSVKGSVCLPRPYFSPPHTHQTKSVFLEALRSVSRQGSWRAVCGTRDKPWPGTTVWAFPTNHGKGSSLNRFSKCKAARWGCELWKTKVSDIPGPFQNVFWRAQLHGVFCKAFYDYISQQKTQDCFKERKTNKKMQFNSKYLKRVSREPNFGKHTAVFIWR